MTGGTQRLDGDGRLTVPMLGVAVASLLVGMIAATWLLASEIGLWMVAPGYALALALGCGAGYVRTRSWRDTAVFAALLLAPLVALLALAFLGFLGASGNWPWVAACALGAVVAGAAAYANARSPAAARSYAAGALAMSGLAVGVITLLARAAGGD